jgi:hypothetical protein
MRDVPLSGAVIGAMNGAVPSSEKVSETRRLVFVTSVMK